MARRERLGIFIGRFQPFHKGHLHALRYCLAHCDTLIIGIGSSEEFGTDSNPFSSDDRMRIIKAALKGAGIGMHRIRFLNIPDFHDNDVWFDYIMRKEPRIEVVFSRNRLVKRIFSDHAIAVASPVWHRRDILKATKIRKIIRSGKGWESRVPRGAVREIALRQGKIKSSAAHRKLGQIKVVIGGTFGHLHRGHITLISKAFEIGDFVYVGLTTDGYVKRMKPSEKIPRYAQRKRALIALLRGFRKGYSVEPLDDRYGPAATGDFDAIVVSMETLPAAVKINRMRRANGLRPMRIVKIGYVLAADARPISTSRIARGEIDKEGNRI